MHGSQLTHLCIGFILEIKADESLSLWRFKSCQSERKLNCFCGSADRLFSQFIHSFTAEVMHCFSSKTKQLVVITCCQGSCQCVKPCVSSLVIETETGEPVSNWLQTRIIKSVKKGDCSFQNNWPKLVFSHLDKQWHFPKCSIISIYSAVIENYRRCQLLLFNYKPLI